MGKGFQDGLIMDNSFLIIDEKKPGFQVPARIIQILAIVIGSWSAFSVLVQGLTAPVDYAQMNAAILIFSGLMFGLCIVPKYDLVKLFFAVLFYGLFFLSRFPRLQNGFYLIENLVIKRLFEIYDFNGYYFKADKTFLVQDITLLIIMVMIPVIALTAVAVVRNRLANLCSLTLLLPVTASFLLGEIPSEKYLIAYIAAILYLAKSGLPYRHIPNKDQRSLLHRISSRAAVWTSLLGLLVFFILKLFINENQYDNIAQLNEMKTKVQQTFMETSIEDISEKITDYKLFEFEANTGGLLGGELGKDGKVVFTGDEQLIITAPYSSVAEGFYLKGYVGDVYTGKRWTGHSKEDKRRYYELLDKMPVSSFSAVNQTNNLLNLLVDRFDSKGDILRMLLDGVEAELDKYNVHEGTMTEEYKGANKKYIYAPYYTNYSLLDRTYYQEDLYTAPTIRSDYYQFQFMYNISLGRDDTLLQKLQDLDYTGYEKIYREYVYDVYTKLPEKGLNRLKAQFSEGNDEFKSMNLTDKLDFVKSYLEQNTQYTLSPGKLPKGEDFVEYFLYENKKGYCAHYASTATLMLRAMGVPARYVEGYAIGADQVVLSEDNSTQEINSYTAEGIIHYKNQNEKIIVRDSNAHAWVEVYVDGCGWIPIEFTPGSVMQYNTAEIAELSKAEEYIGQNDEKAQTTPTPAPEQDVVNNDQSNPDQLLEQQTQKAIADAKEKAKLDQVFFTVFLLLIGASVFILLIIMMKRRNRFKHLRGHNKRAIFLFAEVEKILSACKGGLPGKKARLEDHEEYIRERSPYIDPKIFVACMETVKKARFGNGSISDKELKQIEEFREKLYKSVYEELPAYKRLGLKLSLLI